MELYGVRAQRLRSSGPSSPLVVSPGIHQVFGKRAAVEKDQEKISTCELLLEGRLRRLGVVQSHLQARPRVSVEAMTPTFGGTFTEVSP